MTLLNLVINVSVSSGGEWAFFHLNTIEEGARPPTKRHIGWPLVGLVSDLSVLIIAHNPLFLDIHTQLTPTKARKASTLHLSGKAVMKSTDKHALTY